ncbi:MAG TPA: hypothetical protein VGW77_27720 [Candidatus Binatia bacterium]|jgi:hypothetical protein|nr:hypothetical protein [Candidatus Binatia bacterium]
MILFLILALPLAFAGVVYLAVDSAPNINRAAEITPSNIERAKRILDQNDPRKLKPGVRRTISVSQNDLDLAANYLARQYAAGGARVQLNRGTTDIGASLRLSIVPLPIYLNFEATLVEDGALPRFAFLRVGKISIPAWAAHWLIPRLFTLAFGDADLRTFSNVIKKVSVNESRIALTYEWQADLPDRLRNVLLPAEERERLRIYQERLVAVSRSLKTKNISLTELLVPLFTLAAERSTDDNAIAENRAAILLLTLYVNGQGMEMILPDAKNWPRPIKHDVLLNQRDDFPKHFIISAALSAKAGGPLSDAVGIYKEIDDSRGGSGFSFNDIAADRAGTRFGEYAASAASARKLQQRLRAGIGEKDLMPPTEDLPEFMPEREFIRRYGGVDAPEYNKMTVDIERRIAALPLYR